MSKNNKNVVRRKYKMSDGQLATKASNILYDLKRFLPAFTAFDPSINANFVVELEKLTGEKDIKDVNLFTSVNIEIKLETKQLNTLLADARTLYSGVKYYVKRTFPGQQAIWNEFGANSYLKCRNSQLLMEQFMEQLVASMKKYQPQLKESGMPTTLPTEVETLTRKINEENDKQEQKKKERPGKTQQHIIDMNKTYDMLIQVSDASRFVYSNDKLMRELFIVYKGIRRKKRKKKTDAPTSETVETAKTQGTEGSQ